MANLSMQEGNFLVATLQLKTATSYRKSLTTLLTYIHNSSADLIVVPELYLTNFDYEHFNEAAAFYQEALEELLVVAPLKVICLTMIKKEQQSFYNEALVLHQERIVHQQNKYKLFKLGNEHQYFTAGTKEQIVKFTIDNICYALLICFELRFKALWKEIEGADIVLIPARWGKLRKEHLEVLSRALAIMNQVFVIVSNSGDEDMARSSAIISPWGEVVMDDKVDVIEKGIDFKEIKKVRRLISMN